MFQGVNRVFVCACAREKDTERQRDRETGRYEKEKRPEYEQWVKVQSHTQITTAYHFTVFNKSKQ